MSASNHNYVCFACRTSIRHPKVTQRTPKCLRCGVECFCLGYKVEIPRHSDVKAWQLLERKSLRRQQESEESARLRKIHRQHFLEREIARLGKMPANRDRQRLIHQLQKELRLL